LQHRCTRLRNPLLSDEAEQVSNDYEENAEFIQLFLSEDEIDIVVGSSLTELPWLLTYSCGKSFRISDAHP
jgi:hypothetical protein